MVKEKLTVNFSSFNRIHFFTLQRVSKTLFILFSSVRLPCRPPCCRFAIKTTDGSDTGRIGYRLKKRRAFQWTQYGRAAGLELLGSVLNPSTWRLPRPRSRRSASSSRTACSTRSSTSTRGERSQLACLSGHLCLAAFPRDEALFTFVA